VGGFFIFAYCFVRTASVSADSANQNIQAKLSYHHLR